MRRPGVRPSGMRMIGGVSVLSLLLSGCSFFSIFDSEPESVAPALPTGSCAQQAQALGFKVRGVETTSTGPEGSQTWVLVDWSDNGGAHLICRPGPNGTVTVG
jgi:hypothetical protein